MTIIEEKPITLAEVVERCKSDEKALPIKKFVEGFNKMSFEDASKLQEELKSLDLVKLKDSHIVKIVDFMPKSASEVNKVLGDVSLDSEEVGKILEVTKKK